MRICLTGASGFIGAHVLRTALARGHEVLTLAPEPNPWRIRDIASQATNIQADLASIDAQQRAVRWGADACLHLAWYAEPNKYLHATENIGVLSSSLAWLTSLMNGGCRQFVIAGTCAEYDLSLGYLNEDSPTDPGSVYAATKCALNLVSRRLAEQHGARCAWGRIFFPYGPMEDERRVLPAVISSLLKGQAFPATPGEQVRDYVHVEDIALAFVMLAENQAHGTYNIASGRPVTLRHAMESAGDLIGRRDLIEFGRINYRENEPMFVCGNNRKLRDATGWMPRYGSIEQGLPPTIDWWRQWLAAH